MQLFSLKAKDRILEAKQLLNHKIINLTLLTSLMLFQTAKKTEILPKFKTQPHIVETLLSLLPKLNFQYQPKIWTISSDLNSFTLIHFLNKL